MGASESVIQKSNSQISIFTLDPIPGPPREVAENLIRCDPCIPRIRYIISMGAPLILISSTLESSEGFRSVLRELVSILFTPLALSQALAAFKESQIASGNTKSESTFEGYLETCALSVWKSPEDLKGLVEDKFKKFATSSTFSIPQSQTKLKTLIGEAAKTRGLKVVLNERQF